MKTYVLTIAQKFPKSHPCAGEATHFADQINLGIKQHTIRLNYALWKKRFEKINKGDACISVRQWKGRPYFSKQEEIDILFNTDGIGLQKLHAYETMLYVDKIDKAIPTHIIATNDGLSLKEFQGWFQLPLEEDAAIIWFNENRYQ